MASGKEKFILFWTSLFILQIVQGVPVPVPNPRPQVLPGQIPVHLASHPALSSITQGRESALMQYAFNTQNRRGPSPSPLVLQNNQERNLHLANQVSHQRSGQAFIPSTGGQGGHGHSHGNESPETRALDLIQQFKGNGQTQNSYNPVALGPSTNGHQHQHNYQPLPGVGPSSIPPGDDNEGEDIRKLKSLLNISGRPIQGSSASNYGRAGIPPGAGSPTIGVAGERGVLNPQQFGQNSQHHDHSGHSHHHSTPFPVTAQSQNSLGSLQFGQSPRPYLYSGGSGPTGGQANVVQVPYGGDSNQHAHHGHDHQRHGQDARTLIQSLETPSEAYQNLVYIDPVREPTSINKHIGPKQSVFILPASDYTSDDYQRLLNRPAEILIDVIPATSSASGGNQQETGSEFSLHNFSLLLTPSTYARCAQATHKRGYGGKCKLILKVGKKGGSVTQPVQVSY